MNNAITFGRDLLRILGIDPDKRHITEFEIKVNFQTGIGLVYLTEHVYDNYADGELSPCVRFTTLEVEEEEMP